MKKTIISLAMAFALTASLIPSYQNVYAAKNPISSDTVTIDGVEYGTGSLKTPMDDQIADMLNSYVPVKNKISKSRTGELESSYKSKGAELTLRNQGSFGTCWAFSAMALAEIDMVTNSGVSSPDYSELQLAYFTYNHVTDPLGGTKGDYNSISDEEQYDYLTLGGNRFLASNKLASWTGAVSETDYPATAYSNAASGYTLGDEYAYSKDAVHLQNYYYASLDVSDGIDNLAAAKQLIKEYGGLSAAFCASTSYYNSTYNSFYYPDSVGSNHNITIVGWDDEFSKNNFGDNTPEGDGAWLIRNSWSSDTPDANTNTGYSFYGLFWMSYYDKSLEPYALAYDFESADNYDNNYQYDGSMYEESSYYYDKTQASFANIFTANASDYGESLKAVSFATETQNVSYTVKIYTDVEDTPQSGTLKTTKSGTVTDAGYYTVKLDESVSLEPGQRYSVVVEITGDGTNEITMQNEVSDKNWFITYASMSRGQSFVKPDGYSWLDFYDVTEYEPSYDEETGEWTDNQEIGNYQIKAFTTNNEADESIVKATSISLDKPGTISLATGDTLTVTPSITPATATNKKVCYESSNENVATVDYNGVVTAVNAGTAVITATPYVGEGEAQFTVNVKKSISGATVSSIADQTYTGSAITPSFTVKYDDSELYENTDYTVSYSNNINPGTATITISGTGSYAGTKTVTFNITAVDDEENDTEDAQPVVLTPETVSNPVEENDTEDAQPVVLTPETVSNPVEGDNQSATELVNPVISVSKAKIKKGKRTPITISSSSGMKVSIKASNKLAKSAYKSKRIKIKNAVKGKIIFTKKAKKGKYKFKVSQAASSSYTSIEKTITIIVK